MKIEMVTGNSVFDLSNRSEYLHLSNVGLGLPAVEIYQEIGPLQDGATYTDYRLQPRDLTLIIGTPASTFEEYMQLRRQLYNIFKPKRRSNLALRVTLDTGEVWQLDVVYVDGLEADGNDKKGYFHKYAIALRAHEPTWYDPTQITIPFAVLSSAGFSVPMTVPLSVGISTLNQTVSVAYEGTADSLPIFTVLGPVENLAIQNLTLGDSITISGEIPTGDTWTIDTRYGRKTITDQNGVNKIRFYEGDLATFRLLAAEDDSASFVNDIKVTGDNANSSTRIVLQYFNRYIGM